MSGVAVDRSCSGWVGASATGVTRPVLGGQALLQRGVVVVVQVHHCLSRHSGARAIVQQQAFVRDRLWDV